MIHTLESWDTHWTHTSKAWDTVGYNKYKFWDALYLQDWGVVTLNSLKTAYMFKTSTAQANPTQMEGEGGQHVVAQK